MLVVSGMGCVSFPSASGKDLLLCMMESVKNVFLMSDTQNTDTTCNNDNPYYEK